MKSIFNIISLILTNMSLAGKMENQLYCIASKAQIKKSNSKAN